MFFNNFGFAGDGTLGATFTSADWKSIIDQGFGIGSQLIGAYGKRPTTQIASNSGGIFAIQPAKTNYDDTTNYSLLAQQQALALRNQDGGGLDAGVNSLLSWASSNSLVLVAAGVGLYLLMREPPRSKR